VHIRGPYTSLRDLLSDKREGRSPHKGENIDGGITKLSGTSKGREKAKEA